MRNSKKKIKKNFCYESGNFWYKCGNKIKKLSDKNFVVTFFVKKVDFVVTKVEQL